MSKNLRLICWLPSRKLDSRKSLCGEKVIKDNYDSVKNCESNFDTSRSNTCNQSDVDDSNDDVVQLGSTNQLCNEPESNITVKRLHSRLPTLAQACVRHGFSDSS